MQSRCYYHYIMFEAPIVFITIDLITQFDCIIHLMVKCSQIISTGLPSDGLQRRNKRTDEWQMRKQNVFLKSLWIIFGTAFIVLAAVYSTICIKYINSSIIMKYSIIIVMATQFSKSRWYPSCFRTSWDQILLEMWLDDSTDLIASSE